MKTIKMIRFPNESDFQEFPIDMEKFKPEKEFEDQTFGWYDDGTYISIKKG